MIHGEKSIFAIECEPFDADKRWIYAHFRFWAEGQGIGDYTEHAILHACTSWLREFLLFSDRRREPALDDLSKEDVFRLVFDSVMVTLPKGGTISDLLDSDENLLEIAPPIFENVRERFHLDQVGMSSFADKWNVILVESKDGSDRLIWRNLDDLQLFEAILPPGYFDNVASQFLHWADSLANRDDSGNSHKLT